MKTNKDLAQEIIASLKNNKKTPKIGWKPSGSLKFFHIVNRRTFLKNQVQYCIENIIDQNLEVYLKDNDEPILLPGGSYDAHIVAQKLIWACWGILDDEKIYHEPKGFEKEVGPLAELAATEIIQGDLLKKHVKQFIDKITDFHPTDDLYSQLLSILNVKEIPDAQLRNISDAVDWYQILISADLTAPAESEQEAALLWLTRGYNKGDAEFKKRFKNLDSKTRNRIAFVDFPNNLDIMNAGECESDRLLHLISKAIDSIKKDSAKQKRPAGPLDFLIYNLCGIYEGLTDRKATVSYYGNSKNAS